MSRVVKRSTGQAVKAGRSRRDASLPQFVRPQLSQPVEKPPSGPQWVDEIKLDGYRMAARMDDPSTWRWQVNAILAEQSVTGSRPAADLTSFDQL
jgi:hypothetical protein